MDDHEDRAAGDALAGAATDPSRMSSGRSGAEIAEGLTSEDAAVACGVSGPVGTRWFRERGGMPLISWAGRRAGTCRSPSARRSHYCMAGSSGSARSPAGLVEIPQRSRASCAATRPPAAASSSTGPRPRSGRPSWRPAAPRPRSWPRTSGCATTSRTGSPAWCARPTGWRCRDRPPRNGRAATGLAARIDGGLRPGARSRSLTGCRSSSPTMSPCGSPTRRSTSRCSSRDAERCAASSSPACAPDARCASHERALAGGARSS